jgi:hypothetical protein
MYLCKVTVKSTVESVHRLDHLAPYRAGSLGPPANISQLDPIPRLRVEVTLMARPS